MGALEDLQSGERLPLRPDHLVGRSERADLRIDDRSVSGEHASLRWTGRSWIVRDRGSRNGTWVAGRRLPSGETVGIEVGETVAFGSEAPRFRLVDASQPGVSAVDATGKRWFGGPDLLALPSPEDPRLMIVGDGAGKWQAESDEGIRDVAEGERVRVGDLQFTLSLPEPPGGTWDRERPGASLADVALRFRVSRDEEHVELLADVAGRTHDLGTRSHYYLLLTLARLRLADAADPELRESSHGWVAQERLLKMLAVRDPGNLNLSVFRARAVFAELGVADAAGLVERRRGAGQLRIGVGRIAIETV